MSRNVSSEEDVLALLQQQIDRLTESRQQQLQLNADKAAAEAALRNAAIQCAQGLVRLNIGGVKYTTSLSTLTAVPNSFFASLFSGDWQSAQTTEGDVFVDRDGEVFKHILRYLRAVRDQQSYACAESLSTDDLAAIAAEAHFYGLEDLERATAERQRTGGYEYKYLTISIDGTQVYDPKVVIVPRSEPRVNGSGPCLEPGVYRPPRQALMQEVHPWQDYGMVYTKTHVQEGAAEGTRELGPDPGNLLHLHREGWEYVDSHCGTSRLEEFMVVLRRKL